MSLINKLCIDVQLIVYRYVFDYNYSIVKHDYLITWFCDDIHWCDLRQYFRSEAYGGIANWRNIYHFHAARPCYKFPLKTWDLIQCAMVRLY